MHCAHARGGSVALGFTRNVCVRLAWGAQVALRSSQEARQGGAAVKHSRGRWFNQGQSVDIEHPIKHIQQRGWQPTPIKTFLGLPIQRVVLGPKCAAWVPVCCQYTSHASARGWDRKSAVCRMTPERGVRRKPRKRLRGGGANTSATKA